MPWRSHLSNAASLGGACGYLSFTGEMDLAIAIRTGVIKDQTLYVQAGAGIVADSVAESSGRKRRARRAVMRAAGDCRGERARTAGRPAQLGSSGQPSRLLIDNYDSFTYNLVQYFGSWVWRFTTVHNDAHTRLGPARSPGC